MSSTIHRLKLNLAKVLNWVFQENLFTNLVLNKLKPAIIFFMVGLIHLIIKSYDEKTMYGGMDIIQNIKIILL